MNAVDPFTEPQVESLARLLGGCATGSDIDRVFKSRGITDRSGESTKWKRLYWVFGDLQARHNCANHVLDFIRTVLAPARFVGRNVEFEAHRADLNAILAFSGLAYRADGQYSRTTTAKTIDEAEQRLRAIQFKFRDRRLHSEVLKYCRTELLQDNYFHAVFEAAKGLAQRIRDMSGNQEDGARLVDSVFLGDRPVLAINSLRTETERSEQKGFAFLLKGCFGAIRNPLAHGPKILWEGEDDAADYLSLISLLHRKLDECVQTGYGLAS